MGDAPLRPLTHSLPRLRTSIIGRDAEVAALSALLVGADSSLITLTGSGGVGKTRLALQVAHDLQSVFRDGVCLVDLQTISEPHLVVTFVASAFDVVQQDPSSPLDSLAEFVRPKHMLLVLDNCEHVVGSCAQIADHLLRMCNNVRILATSRELLRTPGEQVWPVRPLGIPTHENDHKAVHAIRCDAVRLFVQRAQALSPAFTLTDENATDVSEICRQLDGVPFAIELAAARVSALTPKQIASRLSDRFNLFSSGHRSPNDRHRSLRHVIEWSYDLLSRSEQAVLNRMAVFSGGCSLEAIESICADGIGEPETLQCLTRLIEKSLVVIDDDTAMRRYCLLETVRLLARERLVSSGEVVTINQRHADFFLRLAETAESGLWTSNGTFWLNVLESEHDNMRAVLRRSVGQGSAEMGQRLGAALYRFWMLRGHLAEGLHWLDGALSWQSGTAPDVRARALNAAGHLARAYGSFGLATKYYEESLELHRHMPNIRGAALTLNSLGVVAQFQSDFARAIELHEESLSLFRAVSDVAGTAVAVVTLGTMAQLRGDYDRAFELCEEGLALFRELGDRHGVASALNNLGNVARASGRQDYAANCYREAIALFRELNDRRELAACLRNFAISADNDGNHRQALAMARESAALSAEQRDDAGVLASGMLLASITAEMGRELDAVRLLSAIESTRKKLGAARELPRDSGQESLIAWLRDRIGADCFASAWMSGATMQLVDAVQLTAEEHQEPESAAAQSKPELSPRQREVAMLIAQGLSNKGIAEVLFISERTADAHVEHILRKLGMRSRAQVASWETERRSQAGPSSSDSFSAGNGAATGIN